jgi:hypothetical protein
MMLLWACAGVPLGAYNISSDFNIALQIQPQILTVLSLITWGQCFYYGDVSCNFLLILVWGGRKGQVVSEGRTATDQDFRSRNGIW